MAGFRPLDPVHGKRPHGPRKLDVRDAVVRGCIGQELFQAAAGPIDTAPLAGAV
jgi:hypothetical protein